MKFRRGFFNTFKSDAGFSVKDRTFKDSEYVRRLDTLNVILCVGQVMRI